MMGWGGGGGGCFEVGFERGVGVWGLGLELIPSDWKKV